MRKKSVKFKIVELFVGKIDHSVTKGFWLVSELINKHKYFLLLLLAAGILIGFIEGAAIGLLAYSVVVIIGEKNICPSSLMTIDSYIPFDICQDYDKYDLFLFIVIASIVIQFVKAFSNYGSSYLAIVLRTRVAFEMKTRVLSHMLELSYQELNYYSVGERQALINKANVFSNLVGVMNNIVVVLCVLFSYFAILIGMNWQLSIFSFFLIVLLLLIIVPFLEKFKALAIEERNNSIKLQRKIIDYLFAIRLIKLYGKSAQVIASMKNIIAREIGLARSTGLLSSAVPNIQETIIVTSVALVLLISFYLSGENADSVLPAILAYILVLNRCNGRVVMLNAIRAKLAKAIAPLTYISDFLNHKDSNPVRGNGRKINESWKKIKLNNLSFRYSNESDAVLSGIDLEISRGETVAIVGKSGSGKSTLVDIIVGLLVPSSGLISFDNIKSTGVDVSHWLEKFSMVSQNDLILDGTVLENLLFANENATKQEAIEACKITEAHEFIMSMDDGYDSVLGERGYKVSGGQIQRIAFARALLKASPLLILDEATSALDTITERRIVKSFEKLGIDKTIIMIAHRLSTIVDADKVFVMDKGKIVDSGEHKELIIRDGLYKDMWEIQSNI